MASLLTHVAAQRRSMVAMLREFVECESPSDDPPSVNRFVELLANRFSSVGRVRVLRAGGRGNHLRCELRLPGRTRQGQLLLLGHSDTVWPVGTLKTMPFRETGDRVFGPGVLDMKSGLVFLYFAAQWLVETGEPVRKKVVLFVNSDEEVGSESSRPLIEEEARRSDAVLVLEPGTGLSGKLKTARKGVGDYTITVRGRAAHAGLDFTAGANAIVELARQIQKVSEFVDLPRGITVNPGVISGGSRSNVVPAEARAEVDIRVLKLRDAAALDRKFRKLRPFDRRCTVEVSGGLNRPPMERSAGGRRLFRIAQNLGRELGVEIEESTVGGGSDGNFTAALGVPTLDGLGGVGEGAHASNECILTERMADRTALLAKLIAAI